MHVQPIGWRRFSVVILIGVWAVLVFGFRVIDPSSGWSWALLIGMFAAAELGGWLLDRRRTRDVAAFTRVGVRGVVVVSDGFDAPRAHQRSLISNRPMGDGFPVTLRTVGPAKATIAGGQRVGLELSDGRTVEGHVVNPDRQPMLKRAT